MATALNKSRSVSVGFRSDNTAAAAEVMLVYEDMSTGFRAFQCFEYLDQMLNGGKSDTELHWTLWKLGLFNTPEFYDAAVLAAVGADVIVMSLHGNRSLESAIESWLTAWVSQRGEKECALGVLFDADVRETDLVKDTLFRLQQTTKQSVVELVIGFISPRVVEEAARGQQCQRDISTSIVAFHNAPQEFKAYSHWGLNE